MSSIISKLADEIKLHGSYEAYCAFRDKDQVKKEDLDQKKNLHWPGWILPETDDSQLVENHRCKDAKAFYNEVLGTWN